MTDQDRLNARCLAGGDGVSHPDEVRTHSDERLLILPATHLPDLSQSWMWGALLSSMLETMPALIERLKQESEQSKLQWKQFQDDAAKTAVPFSSVGPPPKSIFLSVAQDFNASIAQASPTQMGIFPTQNGPRRPLMIVQMIINSINSIEWVSLWFHFLPTRQAFRSGLTWEGRNLRGCPSTELILLPMLFSHRDRITRRG